MTRAQIHARAAAIARRPALVSVAELERLADQLIGRSPQGFILTRHQLAHRNRKELSWDPSLLPANSPDVCSSWR